MANQASNKMLICLWKGCDCMFDETTAFQEHVNKHVLEQQQLELSNQVNNGTVTVVTAEEEPMAKKAKMDHEEEDNKVINKDKKVSVCLAIEVWTDVFGFIRRIQLARSVSLTTRHFRNICWPRLHGNKVEVHKLGEITICSRERFDWSRPTEIFVLNGIKNGKELPFPRCPPPDYITGFRKIQINYMDERVVEFMKFIAPRIVAKGGVFIQLETENLDEKQWASVNQLLHIFREDFPEPNLHVQCSTIKQLQEMDNKIQTIRFHLNKEESDIRLLMNMLKTPRADGKQHVLILGHFRTNLAQKMLNAIKQEFHGSTQPLPQPFYVRILRRHMSNTKHEYNPQTNERLTITLDESGYLRICRHPKGQFKELANDAKKRIDELYNCKTSINVKIKHFD